MKKLIIILLSCFLLTGCSLVKTLVSPFKSFKSSLPQQTEQSKVKVVCKGEMNVDENGNVIYCSRGYYSYASNYEQKERKLSLKEKIIQFFDHLTGYFFWIAIALVFICPSALGFIFGRVIEAVAGIGSKALKSTVKAIQKVRKDGKNINEALASEQDSDVKTYIAKLKQKENIT